MNRLSDIVTASRAWLVLPIALSMVMLALPSHARWVKRCETLSELREWSPGNYGPMQTTRCSDVWEPDPSPPAIESRGPSPIAEAFMLVCKNGGKSDDDCLKMLLEALTKK